MKQSVIAIAAASLALAGCATTNFSADYDQAHDFSAYKSFAWAGEKPMTVLGSAQVPPVVEQRIASEVRSALEAKGYRYTEQLADADFGVSFTVGRRDATKVISSPEYFWVNQTNWRWGRAYYPAYTGVYRRPVGVTAANSVAVTTKEVKAYSEGTLAIDIYDVASKSPVWHGAGTRTVERTGRPSAAAKATTEKVRSAVTRILEDFPPK
jgi:hypothetical protein